MEEKLLERKNPKERKKNEENKHIVPNKKLKIEIKEIEVQNEEKLKKELDELRLENNRLKLFEEKFYLKSSSKIK